MEKKARITEKIQVTLPNETICFAQLGILEKVDIDDANGIATLLASFDFGGSGQGLQIVIDNYNKVHKKRIGTAFGLEIILRIMSIFEVEHFTHLKGKSAYALYLDSKWGSIIKGIMNPYTKAYILVDEVLAEMKEHDWKNIE